MSTRARKGFSPWTDLQCAVKTINDRSAAMEVPEQDRTGQDSTASARSTWRYALGTVLYCSPGTSLFQAF